MTVFQYSEEAEEYLKKKDKRLGEVIEKIGHIERTVEPDLFVSLMNSIVGQQISTSAFHTVWGRVTALLGEVTPERVAACSREELQSLGLSFRKVDYMQDAARKVLSGEIDLEGLKELPDEEVCRELCTLKGVGRWTAEMLMLFSMQRMDVLSFQDFGICKGLRMLYHHKEITKERFERYRRRYSPYGSVASLYLWAVAGGAIEGMKDYGK